MKRSFPSAPDEHFLARAYDLALLPARPPLPNPSVGAVLVCDSKIIGEGWHQEAGQAHAEVRCIDSVKKEHKHLIAHSTLYVTLEPCHHQGRTPPCTHLILRHKIPRIVVGTWDPHPLVNGNGIRFLREKGLEVILSRQAGKYQNLITPFLTCHTLQRPYVILKWAQSNDFFLGLKDEQTTITQPATQVMVHTLRHRVHSIMVGTNTALVDNPQLTDRYSPHANPRRILVDFEEKVPKASALFVDPGCLIFTQKSSRKNRTSEWIHVEEKRNIPLLLNHLYEKNLFSVMVEGGAALLKSFVRENLWDEAHVFTSDHCLEKGIRAPSIKGRLLSEQKLGHDHYQMIENPTTDVKISLKAEAV